MEDKELLEELKKHIDNEELFKKYFIDIVEEHLGSKTFDDYIKSIINHKISKDKIYKGIEKDTIDGLVEELLIEKYRVKFYNIIEGLKIILIDN